MHEVFFLLITFRYVIFYNKIKLKQSPIHCKIHIGPQGQDISQHNMMPRGAQDFENLIMSLENKTNRKMAEISSFTILLPGSIIYRRNLWLIFPERLALLLSKNVGLAAFYYIFYKILQDPLTSF